MFSSGFHVESMSHFCSQVQVLKSALGNVKDIDCKALEGKNFNADQTFSYEWAQCLMKIPTY